MQYLQTGSEEVYHVKIQKVYLNMAQLESVKFDGLITNWKILLDATFVDKGSINIIGAVVFERQRRVLLITDACNCGFSCFVIFILVICLVGKQ